MKPALHLALFAALLVLVSGCKTAEDYARNNQTTARWLTTQAGSAGMNVGGRWYSEDWGHATLEQKGNRVTGILGDYPVGGVINGRTLYLAITQDQWTSYSAVLALMRDGSLEGFYSDSVPFDPLNSEPIRIYRVAR